ncbi:MAG: TrkH family potassium uptake protein [Halanaerobium sp.]|nr:TrkH family potassium uptake protein [Halanaerobium sp.]
MDIRERSRGKLNYYYKREVPVIRDIRLTPAQVLTIWYLSAIIIGTILLSLPMATATGRGVDWIDALFTSTSATCVTGLIVVNTAEHWSIFGKAVIMLLIQFGGIGLMTTSTLFAVLLGRKITLKARLIIKEEVNSLQLSGIIHLTLRIFYLTFAFEALGTAVLFFRFLGEMPLARAFFFAAFHAVSAFNNAGFDLFGNSLEGYTSDLVITTVIALLFIIGGLGFSVIVDYLENRSWRRLNLHSKLVLTITAILIVIGFLIVFILELSNPATLGSLGWQGKILGAFFQGVTPRTAGFNSIPIDLLRPATLFILIFLMFIGASPGSTGGGVKTTTAGALLAVVYNLVRDREDVQIYGRRLDRNTVYRALSVVVISASFIVLIVLLLLLTENGSFLEVLFETVSAFGTVGLSMGQTPDLTEIGRILIVFMMFVGRVGPLTLALAIGNMSPGRQKLRYPLEKILIG